MRDMTFEKVNEDIRKELDNYASFLGENIARKIVDEMGTDVFLIARKLGVKIVLAPESGFQGVTHFEAEYLRSPPTILIYNSNHKTESKVILQVAHELFHHLEETRLAPIRQEFKIDGLKIGPLRIELVVQALSEVAANAFAETLLNARKAQISAA